jgi:hypothetical protein
LNRPCHRALQESGALDLLARRKTVRPATVARDIADPATARRVITKIRGRFQRHSVTNGMPAFHMINVIPVPKTVNTRGNALRCETFLIVRILEALSNVGPEIM